MEDIRIFLQVYENIMVQIIVISIEIPEMLVKIKLLLYYSKESILKIKDFLS